MTGFLYQSAICAFARTKRTRSLRVQFPQEGLQICSIKKKARGEKDDLDSASENAPSASRRVFG